MYFGRQVTTMWRTYCPHHWYASTKLRGVTSQKTAISIYNNKYYAVRRLTDVHTSTF